MSGYDVVAVVEGVDDRSFYSLLIQNRPDSLKVRIALASELVGFGAGNGKSGLLEAYRKLRRIRGLSSAMGGRSRRVVFWVDKDIDDLLRKRAKSPHVVYTTYYNSENHIFSAADLARAVAHAAELDLESVASVLGESQDGWRRRAAAAWEEWTCFCLTVHRHKLGLPGYGEHGSKFHDHCPSMPVPLEREKIMRKAEEMVGSAKLTALLARSRRIVGYLTSRGVWDVVFNGKWYARWLQDVALRASSGRKYRPPDMKALRSAALATIQCENPHVADLAARLRLSISDSVTEPTGPADESKGTYREEPLT